MVPAPGLMIQKQPVFAYLAIFLLIQISEISASSSDGTVLEVFETLQESLQILHDDLENSVDNRDLESDILRLTVLVEELLALTGDGSESSSGLSAAMTAEDTTVDILKTIEEILQHFEDDPEVAENNPEDLTAIVDIVEEILTFLDTDSGGGGKSGASGDSGGSSSTNEEPPKKKKATTEEPEEETKKPKKKKKNDEDEENNDDDDDKPKKKKKKPAKEEEEEEVTKAKITTTEEPVTEKATTKATTTTAAPEPKKKDKDDEDEDSPSKKKEEKDEDE